MFYFCENYSNLVWLRFSHSALPFLTTVSRSKGIVPAFVLKLLLVITVRNVACHPSIFLCMRHFYLYEGYSSPGIGKLVAGVSDMLKHLWHHIFTSAGFALYNSGLWLV